LEEGGEGGGSVPSGKNFFRPKGGGIWTLMTFEKGLFPKKKKKGRAQEGGGERSLIEEKNCGNEPEPRGRGHGRKPCKKTGGGGGGGRVVSPRGGKTLLATKKVETRAHG